jgi:ferredoxin-NADP reductase
MATWHAATLVESRMVASDVKSLTFDVAGWVQHRPGQHYDIRLTAPDGYQAERKYSIASPPEQTGQVEFGIQLLEDGEVSPYLFQIQPGEQVEIHGPIGGYFLWDVSIPGPLVLIGGGSGMVPLMCMLRHHSKHDVPRDIVFLISARSLDKVLYYDELQALQAHDPRFQIAITLTQTQPPDWQGYTRHIDRSMIEETMGQFKNEMPMVYICGPTPFVEAGADTLVMSGFHDHAIRTERFGGTSPIPK